MKLNVVQGILHVSKQVGLDNLQALINSMSKLIVGQWRVSAAVIEMFGDLGLHFGLDSFKKNIEEHFLKYLRNTAASVRSMGVEKSGQLAQ